MRQPQGVLRPVCFLTIRLPVQPQSLTVEEGCRLARENAKDIIACGACAGSIAARRSKLPDPSPGTGFNRKRTFIFSDFNYMGGEFYKNCVRISKVRLQVSRAGCHCCHLTGACCGSA